MLLRAAVGCILGHVPHITHSKGSQPTVSTSPPFQEAVRGHAPGPHPGQTGPVAVPWADGPPDHSAQLFQSSQTCLALPGQHNPPQKNVQCITGLTLTCHLTFLYYTHCIIINYDILYSWWYYL